MDFLKSLAPVAATLLGGPMAGMAVKFLSDKLGVPEGTTEGVTEALAGLGMTSEGRVRLAEIDAALRTHAISVGVNMERLAVESSAAVNSTMRAESASEHWPTYSWRPAIGFAVAMNTLASSILVLAVYGGVMLGSGQALTAVGTLPLVLGALAAISGSVLPILGITAWYRGKSQADPAIPPARRI
jgi:hypothetical protein